MGAIQEWGKYGILTETDIYTRAPEFHTWLVEEKLMNPETVPQAKMKELFSKFAEDFNTATLPHEKYYNLEAWERRMNAVRMGDDISISSGYDPAADEAALKAAHRKATKNSTSFLSRDQLLELRQVERERVESSKMKRLGMNVKDSMGVRYEDGD